MLSTRLKTLAGFHQSSSSSIWDIGCDHGLLGLSFCDNKAIKQIHLVDPSIDVINVLKKKIIDSYITKQPLINVLHAKGQAIVLDSESKTIFIAGMGGKEIQEIILNFIPQLNSADRLVISPHRNILELRKFLLQTELGLLSEVSLEEDGQFYQILCLVKDGSLPKVHPYGEGVWQGSSGEQYRQHQLRSFRGHQDELSKAYVTYLAQLTL